MTLTANILTFELMHCFTEWIKCYVLLVPFLPYYHFYQSVLYYESSAILCMLKYKVIKGHFSLSFILFNYDKYGQN